MKPDARDNLNHPITFKRNKLLYVFFSFKKHHSTEYFCNMLQISAAKVQLFPDTEDVFRNFLYTLTILDQYV